jgi:hypothetical protein
MWLGSHFRNPRAIAIDIRPVRTNKDRRMVLARSRPCGAALEGTEEGDKLDVLIVRVEVYEAKRWPIEVDASFDPVDVLQYAWPYSGGTCRTSRLAVARIGNSRATADADGGNDSHYQRCVEDTGGASRATVPIQTRGLALRQHDRRGTYEGQLGKQRTRNCGAPLMQIFRGNARFKRGVEADERHGAEAGDGGGDEPRADPGWYGKLWPRRQRSQARCRVRDGLLCAPCQGGNGDEHQQVHNEGKLQRPRRILGQQPRNERADAQAEEVGTGRNRRGAGLIFFADQFREPGSVGPGAQANAQTAENAADIQRSDIAAEQKDQGEPGR